MIQITRKERDAILDRYPRAEIKPSKHHFFLVGRYDSAEMQMLYSMRGINPPSYRQRAQAQPRKWYSSNW